MGLPPPDDTPSWFAWIVPVGTVIAALWAFLRRFFAMATRQELYEAIEKAQNRIDERHAENKTDNATLKSDLSAVKAAVARIEGQLSGRYPNLGTRQEG